jgi:hypothetical protein
MDAPRVDPELRHLFDNLILDALPDAERLFESASIPESSG